MLTKNRKLNGTSTSQYFPYNQSHPSIFIADLSGESEKILNIVTAASWVTGYFSVIRPPGVTSVNAQA